MGTLFDQDLKIGVLRRKELLGQCFHAFANGSSTHYELLVDVFPDTIIKVLLYKFAKSIFTAHIHKRIKFINYQGAKVAQEDLIGVSSILKALEC